MDTEERIAVFLDYENLALGARDLGIAFDFGPIADTLALRGRAVVRRAYADWSFFDEDRRALTRHQVELIEMPQHMGASRKNAADIKMAVDAVEMAFEREYISTFVVCTGDSDFSPLVHKLRELTPRVIGVGVENSTSRLLPPACDEFLFYERLEGGEAGEPPARRRRGGGSRPESTTADRTPAPPTERPAPEQEQDQDQEPAAESDPGSLAVPVVQTLAGLATTSDAVTASVLKRALLRKDPTFSESDYGFRSFGEVLRHLAERGLVELSPGPATGDPEVSLAERGGRAESFALLAAVIAESGGAVPLSGLKNRMRKHQPAFSEKALGYRSFLQFCRAAQAEGHVTLRWDDPSDDYLVTVPVT